MVNIAREPDTEPSLKNVILSINSVKAKIDEIGGQVVTKADLALAVRGLATKKELRAAVAELATKEELEAAANKLEATFNHEAQDLGESISSLSDMIAKRLNSRPTWRKYKLW